VDSTFPLSKKSYNNTIAIPEGVLILPCILGHVEKLKYMDHNIVEKDKFPAFEPHVYMERNKIIYSGFPILESK
jgi:hypothetical protein